MDLKNLRFDLSRMIFFFNLEGRLRVDQMKS